MVLLPIRFYGLSTVFTVAVDSCTSVHVHHPPNHPCAAKSHCENLRMCPKQEAYTYTYKNSCTCTVVAVGQSSNLVVLVLVLCNVSVFYLTILIPVVVYYLVLSYTTEIPDTSTIAREYNLMRHTVNIL
jgi:hypothetical protein